MHKLKRKKRDLIRKLTNYVQTRRQRKTQNKEKEDFKNKNNYLKRKSKNKDRFSLKHSSKT